MPPANDPITVSTKPAEFISKIIPYDEEGRKKTIIAAQNNISNVQDYIGRVPINNYEQYVTRSLADPMVKYGLAKEAIREEKINAMLTNPLAYRKARTEIMKYLHSLTADFIQNILSFWISSGFPHDEIDKELRDYVEKMKKQNRILLDALLPLAVKDDGAAASVQASADGKTELFKRE